MPYKAKGKCVYKKNKDGSLGEKVGCTDGPVKKYLAALYASEDERKNEGRDPKKGTGKKPKGSGRRLYTDENPKDTVRVKFSTVKDIRNTLSKKSFKSKSHKRQSQIINLIHQRVRVAKGRTKDPVKKKRLAAAYRYISKRKEASKRKTKRMRKESLFSSLEKIIREEIINALSDKT